MVLWQHGTCAEHLILSAAIKPEPVQINKLVHYWILNVNPNFFFNRQILHNFVFRIFCCAVR